MITTQSGSDDERSGYWVERFIDLPHCFMGRIVCPRCGHPDVCGAIVVDGDGKRQNCALCTICEHKFVLPDVLEFLRSQG